MRFVLAADTAPAILAFTFAGLLGTSGCDTGFGQPCDIPENISQCDETRSESEDGGVTTESSSSCAITQYARCETQVCLTYKGSKAFCSLECITDEDCPGSAKCKPIIGDTTEDGPNPCNTDGGYQAQCYCVKKSAL